MCLYSFKKEILILDAKCSKLSFKHAFTTYGYHIKEKSLIIDDEEKSHNILISRLKLSATRFEETLLKNEPDTDNPLNGVNKLHMYIRKILAAHQNILLKKELQDILNLCWFILTPSMKKKKVERVLKRALSCQTVLRFRDFYNKKDE